MSEFVIAELENRLRQMKFGDLVAEVDNLPRRTDFVHPTDTNTTIIPLIDGTIDRSAFVEDHVRRQSRAERFGHFTESMCDELGPYRVVRIPNYRASGYNKTTFIGWLKSVLSPLGYDLEFPLSNESNEETGEVLIVFYDPIRGAFQGLTILNQKFPFLMAVADFRDLMTFRELDTELDFYMKNLKATRLFARGYNCY
jgi:hypothetical protein